MKRPMEQTRAEQYEPVMVRSQIPRPHYTVSYAGEAVWAESSMQDALSRVNPADPFWRIECQLFQATVSGDRKVGSRRTVYPPS